MRIEFDASTVEPIYDIDSYFKSFGKIDYHAVNATLMQDAIGYVSAWLSGGKKVGKEWVCGDLFGGKGESLSVSLATGKWSDFATGEKGGDLVSLYAAINGLSMHESAIELLGSNVPQVPSFIASKLRQPKPDTVVLQKNWIPAAPWADKHSCVHSVHGQPTRTWRYTNERGQTIGFVARYDPPNSRKQFVPWIFNGSSWQASSWSGLKPLYGLDMLVANTDKAVIVVEGEKAADAARQFVGDEYVVTTWPGGANAVGQVDLSALTGRNVLLWPDADAPGVAAMDKLQGMLDGKCASVEVINVSTLPEKFDAADALADGWVKDKFDQFVGRQFVRLDHLPPAVVSDAAVPLVEAAKKASAFKPRKIPDALLRIPGVLGEIAEWGLANSRKPQPVYAVSAALALGSVLMGRKYVTNSRNWASLYFVVIGKTATGKEAVKWMIESVLEAAGLHHLIGFSRYSSEAGLMSSLIEKPCHVTVMDEFGKVLDSANSPKNVMARDLLKQMMEVWGRCDGTLNPVGYATVGMSKSQLSEIRSRKVTNPALTFVGLTTHETFYDALTGGAIEDGFLNRILVAECHAERTTSTFTAPTPVPDSVIDWCKSINSASPEVTGNYAAISGEVKEVDASVRANPIVVHMSPDAMAEFCTFDQWCIDQMNSNDAMGMADLFGRSNEIAMRLSLIIAKSCRSNVIEKEHARWAIDYVTFWSEETVRQASVSVSNGETDAALKQVEKVLANAHPVEMGHTERELRMYSRKFANLSPQVQMHILERLQRDGVVEFREIERIGGRNRKAWVYVGEE